MKNMIIYWHLSYDTENWLNSKKFENGETKVSYYFEEW